MALAPALGSSSLLWDSPTKSHIDSTGRGYPANFNCVSKTLFFTG